MSNNSMEDPQKNKSWLHSDIYAKPSPSVSVNQAPRTSIFQFGTFGDLISTAGKLLAQNIVYYMIFFMVGMPFFFLFWALGGDQSYLAFREIVKLICYTISVAFAFKVFDSAEFADLGLKLNQRAIHDFLAGLTIAFIVLSMDFVLSLGAGWIVIQGFIWQRMSLAGVLGNILVTFVIFCFVGWSEELLSRGFHLRVISKGLNLPLGVILASLYFSYMHRDNPGASFDYLLNVFVAGLMFSFAFLRTGQLWLAVGLHAGWDFFVTVILNEGSINGLKIFALMDINYVNLPMGFKVISFFLLALITILIYLYTINRKPEPLEW